MAPTAAVAAAPASHDIVFIRRTETFAIENSGLATVTAERCCHGRSEATVDASTTGGTATAGEDYTATSRTITFREPIDAGDIDIPVIDDGEAETLETIDVALSNATGRMALSANRTGTVTVIDNDGLSRLSFAKASTSTFENFGTVELIVVRSGDSSTATSVSYSTGDGSAVSGDDYTETTGMIEIAAGSRISKPIEIPLVNDRSAEGEESFTVTLEAPAGSELQEPATVEVVISDDETPSSDTTPPVTAFHQPLHGYTYSPRNVRDILVFSEDEGAGVKTVQVALRAKMTNGSCRWFSRKARGFVPGPCNKKLWGIRRAGADTVVYTLPEKLRPSRGTNIKFYKAWSRGIDELDNVERSFEKSRNVSRFEVR